MSCTIRNVEGAEHKNVEWLSCTKKCSLRDFHKKKAVIGQLRHPACLALASILPAPVSHSPTCHCSLEIRQISDNPTLICVPGFETLAQTNLRQGCSKPGHPLYAKKLFLWWKVGQSSRVFKNVFYDYTRVFGGDSVWWEEVGSE